MSKTFRAYDPKQTFLLPHSLDDWLPEEHLARYVGDVIAELDLSPIYAYYEQEERGYPPYDPSMMTKLLVYGYTTGVRSSRKIEGACVDLVPFRYLAAGNFPKRTAICDFRRTHQEVLEGLFVQVLRLAKRNGFVKVGTVAIDGTKVAGNAALDSNRDHEELSKLEEKELRKIAKALLDDADQTDAAEDALYGETRGDELPAQVRARKDRLERIREAKKQLEEEAQAQARVQEEKIERRTKIEAETGRKLRGRKPLPPDPTPKEDAKRNVTDPESMILKTRNGYVQGYNAQAAADPESNLILAADIANEANDVHQLNPMLRQVEANLGERPKRAVADAGYWDGKEMRKTPKGVELYVATSKDWKQRKTARGRKSPRGRMPRGITPKERMARKLRTKEGRRTYKLRGATIEPRFGCIKDEQGFRRFLLRGKHGARLEWRLTCTGHNLLRMWHKARSTNPRSKTKRQGRTRRR